MSIAISIGHPNGYGGLSQPKRKLTATENALCGAGVVCRFVIAPFDVVKIRFQVSSTILMRSNKLVNYDLQLQNHAVIRSIKDLPKYQNVIQSIRLIVKEEGLKVKLSVNINSDSSRMYWWM
jgi:hypothetical protein